LPIDALKPFKIDGKVYENVKVTNSKGNSWEVEDRNIQKPLQSKRLN
jgi:hypothetical protein